MSLNGSSNQFQKNTTVKAKFNLYQFNSKSIKSFKSIRSIKSLQNILQSSNNPNTNNIANNTTNSPTNNTTNNANSINHDNLSDIITDPSDSRYFSSSTVNLNKIPNKKKSISNLLNLFKRKLSRFLKLSVPYLSNFLLLYTIYIYCYQFSYVQLYKIKTHSIAISIVFISIFSLFLLYIWFLWLLIVIKGPGLLPQKIPPYTYNNPILDHQIPEYFYCNRDGLPFWCSTCNSIKPLRTSHSSELGHCIPKMDHFCIWIGIVIGKKNYKIFFLFILHFFFLILFVFVSTLIYFPEHIKDVINDTERINPNFIIILFISFLWLSILYGLISQHFYLIFNNQTTIEKLNQERYKKALQKLQKSSKNLHNSEDTPVLDPSNYQYINYNYLNLYRVVIKVSKNDKPFKQSSHLQNWNQVMGSNPLFWFLPINNNNNNNNNSPSNDEYFTEEYLEFLNQKVRDGQITPFKFANNNILNSIENKLNITNNNNNNNTSDNSNILIISNQNPVITVDNDNEIISNLHQNDAVSIVESIVSLPNNNQNHELIFSNLVSNRNSLTNNYLNNNNFPRNSFSNSSVDLSNLNRVSITSAINSINSAMNTIESAINTINSVMSSLNDDITSNRTSSLIRNNSLLVDPNLNNAQRAGIIKESNDIELLRLNSQRLNRNSLLNNQNPASKSISPLPT
ncbi:palmitoyltransferase PFA5 ASCRUDRAFT_70914 [Ascoidea rubescens DSM 1968]|uniref:Palmitoyltransferase n=1 Tax=Ascoidea rubescens DSM 1968 TaxID=1344418 RepID=A0A1D2VFJ0_9ASCO|nr:hypothetical protein ASCRUDRAFT_70914 [Ascoidea rubescens DSM 1968]ODV60395.1 hypothetical protein ASCRUDRAFT_70914 [Ascoidea rubescens DSM 1968]